MCPSLNIIPSTGTFPLLRVLPCPSLDEAIRSRCNISHNRKVVQPGNREFLQKAPHNPSGDVLDRAGRSYSYAGHPAQTRVRCTTATKKFERVLRLPFTRLARVRIEPVGDVGL